MVGILGFAFNDSGIAVPGVMLGVINASLVYLTVRTLPAGGRDVRRVRSRSEVSCSLVLVAVGAGEPAAAARPAGAADDRAGAW